MAVRQTVPGTPVDVTGITPEKEGYIFTTWYQDAACTEAYSQFDCVNGPLTLYAGFTDAAEAVTVTFETFDGTPAAPLTFAKGETLLSKPVSSISTNKEAIPSADGAVMKRVPNYLHIQSRFRKI